MPDETTNPYPEVPAMPDDAAMAAASAHAAEGYPSHGAAAATAVGWQRGWATGYAAGREAAAQAIEAEVLAGDPHPIRAGGLMQAAEIARGGR